jgi:hypothetical protein
VSGENVASKAPFSPLRQSNAALLYRQRQFTLLDRLLSFARLIGRKPMPLMR